MRALLLIVLASAAGQLPARDVPTSADHLAEVEGRANGPACTGSRGAGWLVSAGPTVFSPAGSIV